MSFDQQIKKLDFIKFSYDNASLKTKEQILKNILKSGFRNTGDAVLFHDLLLFMKAYPDNKKLRDLVDESLHILNEYLARIPEKRHNIEKLSNTGISNTFINAIYSFDILRIFVNKYIFFIEFSYFGADQAALFDVFNLVVSDLERVAFGDQNFDMNKWLNCRFSKDPQKKLYQIIQIFDNDTLSDKIKADLFLKLKLFVKVNLNENFSKTFLNFNNDTNVFYHNEVGVNKQVDLFQFADKAVIWPVDLDNDCKKKFQISI